MTMEDVGGIRMEAEMDVSKLRESTRWIETEFDKMMRSTKIVEDGLNRLEGSGKKAAATFEQLQNESKRLRTELEGLAPNTQEFVAKAAQFQKVEAQIKAVREQMEGVGKATSGASLSFGTLFPQLTAANLAARAITASLAELKQIAVVAFSEPIRLAADFETTMANAASTIKGDATPQIDFFKHAILDLTRVLPKDANDLSAGLYQVLSVGITDSADAMNVLTVSAKAAVAGISDTNTAVDAITTVLKAYHLSADQAQTVSDSLFVTVRDGKTTFEQLANSLGRVVPTAALVGVSFDQVNAAIAAMTLSGMSSETAATSLNAFLASVLKASDGTGDAADEAHKLGLEYNSAALQAKGLKQFVDDVSKATGNDAVALETLTGDARGFRAIATLLGGDGENFNAVLADMADKAGAADEAFGKNADTLQNDVKLAWNNLNASLTEAGMDLLPALKDDLERVTEALSDNRDQIEDAARALGDSLVSAIQVVVENAPAIIDALTKIAQAAATVVSGIAAAIHAAGMVSPKNALDAAQAVANPTGYLGDKLTKIGNDYAIDQFNKLRGQAVLDSLADGPMSEADGEGLMSVDDGPPPVTKGGNNKPSSPYVYHPKKGSSKESAEEKAAKKAEKDHEKEMLEMAKLGLDAERQRLEAQKDFLEAKRDTVGLTADEARVLQHLTVVSGQAFDIQHATTFVELMKAMVEQGKDMGKAFEAAGKKIDDARKKADGMMDDSKRKLADLEATEEELGRQFDEQMRKSREDFDRATGQRNTDFDRAWGPGGTEELKNAKAIAEEYVKAKQAITELDNKRELGGLTAAENDKYTQAKATVRGVDAKNDGSVAAYISALSQADPVAQDNALFALDKAATLKEKGQKDADAAAEKAQKDAEAKAEYDRKRHENEMSMELEKQFQWGTLQQWAKDADALLTPEQRLHAQELLDKKAEIDAERTLNENLQKDITKAMTDAFAARDAASAAYAANEVSRFGAIKQAALDAAAAIASAQAAAGGGAGYAGGGMIYGPGGPTDDGITARLSNGEYVQRAAAVSFYGRDFMDAVNSMTFSMPRFAQGGPVTSVSNAETYNVTVNNSGDAARVMARPDMIRWHLRAR